MAVKTLAARYGGERQRGPQTTFHFTIKTGRKHKMAMNGFQREAVLRGNVRKDSAWEIISDFTGFPGLISSVDKVIFSNGNEDVGKIRVVHLQWTMRPFAGPR